jgi:hypothetical protein
MGYSMKLIDQFTNEQVMTLAYKAKASDLIRNDETGQFYRVEKIEGRKAFARRTIQP